MLVDGDEHQAAASGEWTVLRAIASGTADARKPVGQMHMERFKAGRDEPEASPEGNYVPHSVMMLKMKPEGG
jgi:hypothetical protein